MKINRFLLGFSVSLILIFMTATTTVNIMTIKPAIPKSTIVFQDYAYINNATSLGRNASDFIKKYSKHGYITKSITFGSYETRAVIVVMEKY